MFTNSELKCSPMFMALVLHDILFSHNLLTLMCIQGNPLCLVMKAHVAQLEVLYLTLSYQVPICIAGLTGHAGSWIQTHNLHTEVYYQVYNFYL